MRYELHLWLSSNYGGYNFLLCSLLNAYTTRKLIDVHNFILYHFHGCLLYNLVLNLTMLRAVPISFFFVSFFCPTRRLWIALHTIGRPHLTVYFFQHIIVHCPYYFVWYDGLLCLNPEWRHRIRIAVLQKGFFALHSMFWLFQSGFCS